MWFCWLHFLFGRAGETAGAHEIGIGDFFVRDREVGDTLDVEVSVLFLVLHWCWKASTWRVRFLVQLQGWRAGHEVLSVIGRLFFFDGRERLLEPMK